MSESRRRFLTRGMMSALASGLPSCASVPASGGKFSAARLDRLSAYASGFGARGFIIRQSGRNLVSRNTSAAGPSLSITKVLVPLAAAKASADGWLDPTERAAETIPEWRGDPRKSRITLLMLLQQTSGIESGVIPLYRAHPADKGIAAIGLRCVDEPGTVFRYGPGHWEVFAEILRRKLTAKKSTLRSYLDRSVLRPIGLSTGNWRSDSRGVPYLSTGVEFNVNSLVRLGDTLCELLAGKNTRGFDAGHFGRLIRPSAVNPMFGGGLWRNRNASRLGATPINVERHIDDPVSPAFWNHACLSTSQSAELTALIGSGGKRLYLWPSRRQVIARLGASVSWSDIAFLGGIQHATRGG
ncbi:MAG: serine hydrolase [Verrucomicrobiota bacterium]